MYSAIKRFDYRRHIIEIQRNNDGNRRTDKSTINKRSDRTYQSLLRTQTWDYYKENTINKEWNTNKKGQQNKLSHCKRLLNVDEDRR